MKKFLQLSNGVALVAMLIINYLATTGALNGRTVGSVSDQYQSLFTPAGYAFSIWSLIYIGLLAFVIYQGRSLFNSSADDEVVDQVGWWFVITSIANILWILTWIYDYTGLSILIMILLLYGLIRIIFRTNMEMDDAPMHRIAFVWWPFSLYSGWISVALFANISAWLTKIEWQGLGVSEVGWTLFIIALVGIIHLTATWTRNLREFALVGTWGLVAVAVTNWGGVPVVAWASLGVAVLLFISSAIHGFKNRKSFPLSTES